MRLTERALDYLSAGPADVVALIGHICQLPNPPRVVAEHMATALFAGRTEFVREESGRWALSRPLRPSPAIEMPAAAVHRPVTVDSMPIGAPRPAALRMIDPLAVPGRRRTHHCGLAD